MRHLKQLLVAASFSANMVASLNQWLDWFGVPKPLPVWQAAGALVITTGLALLLAAWVLTAPSRTVKE